MTPTVTRIETYAVTNWSDLWVSDCPRCGIVFAIPSAMQERRFKDGKTWYCPNGHPMSYHEDDADRERKRRERLERQLRDEQEFSQRQRDTLAAERRQHAATKGKLTKTKNRIAKGVCPCCNRSFTNLERHMAGQHPQYAPTPEVQP